MMAARIVCVLRAKTKRCLLAPDALWHQSQAACLAIFVEVFKQASCVCGAGLERDDRRTARAQRIQTKEPYVGARIENHPFLMRQRVYRRGHLCREPANVVR